MSDTLSAVRQRVRELLDSTSDYKLAGLLTSVDIELAAHCAYAELLAEDLRVVAEEMRMRGFPTVAATITERLARHRASCFQDDNRGWISVEERLPAFDDDRQFIARNSAGYHACVTNLYRRDGPYSGVYGEDATPEETRDVISGVTHWRPL